MLLVSAVPAGLRDPLSPVHHVSLSDWCALVRRYRQYRSYPFGTAAFARTVALAAVGYRE